MKKFLTSFSVYHIFAIFCWLCISGFLGYFFSWTLIPWTLIFVGIYGIVAFTIAQVFLWIFRKPYKNFRIFITQFYIRSGILFTITLGVIGGFCIYQNDISPASLETYTISNGEKTVVFRAMAHIASDTFYKQVQEQIRTAKSQGYDLFFEWVRPGSDVNQAKFDSILGFQFGADLYPKLSKLYWLRPQKNTDFLGFTGGLDVNADVSIDDIISIYEKKYGVIQLKDASGAVIPAEVLSGTGIKIVRTGSGAETGGGKLTNSGATANTEVTANTGTTTNTGATTENSPSNGGSTISTLSGPVNIEAEIDALINSLSPQELAMVQYLNKAFMNLLFKHQGIGLEAAVSKAAPGLFDTILGARNIHLVEMIEKSSSKKIIITYGALHFDGIFDLLQTHDKRWKIIAPIESSYPTK